MNSGYLVEIQKILSILHHESQRKEEIPLSISEVLYLRKRSITNHNFPPEDVLLDMFQMGLIEKSNVQDVISIRLSNVANNWMTNMNIDEGNFNMSKKQKHYIASHLLNKWILVAELANFFSYFDKDWKGSFIRPIGGVLVPKSLRQFFLVLQELEVIKINGDICELDPYFSFILSSVRKKQGNLSEKALLDKLDMQRQIGLEGELWVVQYEKKRLRESWPNYNGVVTRISEEDVGRGYDIRSVVDPLIEERLIEVKSTRGDDIKFFLTSNELAVAENEGDKYWLYLLIGKEKDKSPKFFYKIQNPVRFFRDSNIDLEPTLFTVKVDTEVVSSRNGIESIDLLNENPEQ